MRIGVNPNKDVKITSKYYHRIIVPVHVPNLMGYFKDSLEVTKLCINSLIRTKHAQSFLTVVNNGSCDEVTLFLQELYKNGKIDQLIHYKENVGKIDAVIPITKTAQEPLITITDGDVLFKNGWMKGVETIFLNFPEAGMVSPVPHGTVYANYTTNTLFDATLKGVLKFQQLCNADDMLLFAKSIGKEKTMYAKKIRLKYQLTVNRNKYSAIVGCGHFVATLRKEVFDKSPKKASNLAYASKADRDYIDIPNEKSGFWRLATPINYAYHMGNQPEPWMYKEFEKLVQETSVESIKLPKEKKIAISNHLKKFIVNRLLLNKKIKPLYFKCLGLREGYHEY